MKRWIIVLLAAATLTGCVTTREVVYREPYASDGYSGNAPYRSDAPTYYRDGDSYYSPAYSDRGDYYFGAGSYGGYGSVGVSYFDYPYYYSVFWPINRWYYDPFAYPGYYYGVTWFPRSYLSLGYSHGWHSHGWLSYSPYRYAWVDSYYDWGRWYNHYPKYRHYYPTPRYGDARVEASRLAEIRRPYPTTYPRSGASGGYSRTQGAPVAPSYSGNRAAIPRSGYGTTRPGAYGKTAPSGDVRRVGAGGTRAAPSTGLFGNQTRGSQAVPRDRLDGPRPYSDSRRELQQRHGNTNPPSRAAVPAQPGTPVRRSLDAPTRPALPVRGTATAPVRSTPDHGIPIRTVRPVQRSTPVTAPSRGAGSAPLPAYPPRGSASQPPARTLLPAPGRSGYAPARSEPAPVRQLEMPARSAPVRANPPATYSAPPETVSRPAPSGSHSGSRSGAVRRVGSTREE